MAGRRGQARLTSRDVKVLLWVLVLQALTRAFDYFNGYGRDPLPAIVEKAMPLWTWGIVFALGGLCLALSMIERWHFGVWLGHAILWLVYLVLTIGFLIESLFNPWLDDIRNSTIMLLSMAVHGLLMVRTGVKAITPDENPQAEEDIIRPREGGE